LAEHGTAQRVLHYEEGLVNAYRRAYVIAYLGIMHAHAQYLVPGGDQQVYVHAAVFTSALNLLPTYTRPLSFLSLLACDASSKHALFTMAPQVDITIPSTTLSDSAKPYTIYHITIRLPLRSYTVQKRYSDFVSFNQSLTEQVGVAPPTTIPGKSWFKSTVSSPELTEQRRQGLENYLQTINDADDDRWKNTPVWRAFLNLPSSLASSSSKTGALHSVLTGPGAGGAPISDPTVWLDSHRDLKAQLHDARLNLTNRDQAGTPQKQHEASAAAKSSLVKAGTLITALEDGLSNMQKSSVSSSQKLGAGELRRRKDLLSAAKKDRDALETLLNAMSQKSKLDSAVANIQEHTDLLSSGNNIQPPARATGSKPPARRVLGKETAETRSLDNQGLLQLQQQKMQDQDLDVDEIRKIVYRQRELGIAINQELEVQNEMLKIVDEDVDRVQGKINIAKKRIGKIS
jgi:regulator of vacuolar morphogenesis